MINNSKQEIIVVFLILSILGIVWYSIKNEINLQTTIVKNDFRRIEDKIDICDKKIEMNREKLKRTSDEIHKILLDSSLIRIPDYQQDNSRYVMFDDIYNIDSLFYEPNEKYQ
ncbi:MAG: hypothetical protein HUJ70_01510 [Pseudobutyrivibrio sp.]|nr:hypothetical protein [Pseudobutyrivibrio sp.]